MSATYTLDLDAVDDTREQRRPMYRRAVRRMSWEDRLDADLANLSRTGSPRYGRHADRAARMLGGVR